MFPETQQSIFQTGRPYYFERLEKANTEIVSTPTQSAWYSFDVGLLCRDMCCCTLPPGIQLFICLTWSGDYCLYDVSWHLDLLLNTNWCTDSMKLIYKIKSFYYLATLIVCGYVSGIETQHELFWGLTTKCANNKCIIRLAYHQSQHYQFQQW